MTTYLTLAAMLLFTISPVLIPAGLHAVLGVWRWRRAKAIPAAA
jgi:hypothetical protein